MNNKPRYINHKSSYQPLEGVVEALKECAMPSRRVETRIPNSYSQLNLLDRIESVLQTPFESDSTRLCGEECRLIAEVTLESQVNSFSGSGRG